MTSFVIRICQNKQADFLGSRLKSGTLSTKILKYFFFAITKTTAKNSFLKKTLRYFEIMFALL